jgi:site-specific recombinase XerD
MTVNYFLDTTSSAILLVVQHKGKKFKHSTGHIIKPTSNWDKTKKQVRSMFNGYESINTELKSLKDYVEKIIREYKILNDHQIPSLDYVKSRIHVDGNNKPIEPEKKDVKTFQDLMTDYLESKKATVKRSTYINYSDAIEKIKDFQTSENCVITFEGINAHLIGKYKRYLSKTEMDQTSLKQYLRLFKYVLNWGVENEYLISYNPSIFKYKAKKGQGHIIYLNTDEIEAIENYVPTSKTHRIVKDYFLLQCYLGLRISDILTLRKEHIKNLHIDKVTQKSKTRIYNPINEKASAILEKYEDKQTKYLLPTFSIATINTALKKIAEEVKINENVVTVRFVGNESIEEVVPKYKLVSSHTGRRSFATNLIYKGCPIAVVSKLLAHSSIAVTELYFKDTPDVIGFIAKNYVMDTQSD